MEDGERGSRQTPATVLDDAVPSHRRIDDGYEGTFVMLVADPLEDISRVDDITFRFKRGEAVTNAKPATGS